MNGRCPYSRRRRGFSLVETMVSVAVLGIALIGLVRMHTTSIRGTSKAEDIGRATEIARQIAEREVNVPLANLPPCGRFNEALDEPGCRLSLGPGTVPAPPKGVDGVCTRYVAEDGIALAENGLVPFVEDAPGNYRIDVWLSSHPSGATGNGQAHVWVCWRDAGGQINQVYTTRLRVEDVWP